MYDRSAGTGTIPGNKNYLNLPWIFLTKKFSEQAKVVSFLHCEPTSGKINSQDIWRSRKFLYKELVTLF